ncbi:hypothetical protein EJ06DRAFT_532550, partial [Trichodelitschia bisporula]
METTSSELASALLQWVNSFDLPSAITSWRDLEDGTVLWRILGDIDPDYFVGPLPELDRKQKENWIPRWQNLKHIDRMVTTYIRDECDKLPALSKKLNPDLKAIAIDGSPQNVIKLVKAVLLAAMYSSYSNERMVQIMQALGPKVAQPIAIAIGEMEELDKRLAEYGADAETGSDIDASTDSEAPAGSHSIERDPELEREEKLIQALQEKRRLEERLADTAADLEETLDRCAALEEELAESKFALDRRRRKTLEDQDFEQLSLQAGRDKDYIAELETDLAQAKASIEQQERQLERLKADAQSKQELRDELQLVKSERDELLQKAKANENLKKKIQALQEHEKANAGLRRDLQNAQEQLHELEAIKERCAALEKANEENAQTIANGEQEIFDQKTTKKRLEHELNVLTQKWEQTRDMLSNAQEAIRELEDRMQEEEAGREDGDHVNSLDAELAADSSTSDDRRKKPKEPSTPATSAEAIIIQQNLAIANASVARLEQRCLDLLQENLGFRAVLDKADDTPDSHPFHHLARKLEDVTKELEDTKSRYIAATTEVADLRHRLDVLGDQAITDSARLAQMQAALAQNHERQAYTQQLEAELRDQKSLLRHALLSTDALVREATPPRSEHEYQLVRTQMEAVRAAPTDTLESVLSAAARVLAGRIEAGHAAVADRDKASHPHHYSVRSKKHNHQHAVAALTPPPDPPAPLRAPKPVRVVAPRRRSTPFF